MDRFAFVSFLKTLVKSVIQPVIVVTDSHLAHREKVISEYIESESKSLGVHLLPAYSPEYNSDEQVWNQLKGKLGKVASKTKDDFIGFIRSRMKSLQKRPKVVSGFFRLLDTKYACRESYVLLVGVSKFYSLESLFV